MIVVQVLVAFCVAMTLTLLLFRKWPRHKSGRNAPASLFGALAIIFLIIFAMSWAGGAWMPAFGPEFYGVSWLSFAVVGLVTALIVATAARPMGEIPPLIKGKPEGKPERELRSLGWLFWVLMLVLIVLGVIFLYEPVAISLNGRFSMSSLHSVQSCKSVAIYLRFDAI